MRRASDAVEHSRDRPASWGSVVQATSCFWGSQSAGLEDVCIFRGEVRRLPCICSVLAL